MTLWPLRGPDLCATLEVADPVPALGPVPGTRVGRNGFPKNAYYIPKRVQSLIPVQTERYNMSELIPRASGSVEKHDGGVLDSVSDGLIIAGLGVAPVWLTAFLLPGGIAVWAVLYVIAGIAIGAVSARD